MTNNREKRLTELKVHLLDRKHSQLIIGESFTKMFQSKFQTENNDNITFIGTYNTTHKTKLKRFHSCLDTIKSKELKTCFQKENYYYPLDNLQNYELR